MAKGMPDWTTDLRIIQGSLRIDPKTDSYSLADFYTVHDIARKGVVYGGFLYAWDQTPGPEIDLVSVTVDGTPVSTITFAELLARGSKGVIVLPWTIGQYDIVNARMTALLGQNIAFNEQLKIEYGYAVGNTGTVKIISHLFYTQIG